MECLLKIRIELVTPKLDLHLRGRAVKWFDHKYFDSGLCSNIPNRPHIAVDLGGVMIS